MKAAKNVVVLGAAGKVGSLVVADALADGHAVTAFVHGNHELPEHSRLRVVKGDVYNRADVEAALAGADVVVSTLSSWGTPYKDVLAAAMTNVVPVAERFGIKRVVSLTGADARVADDDMSLLHRVSHAMLIMIGGKVLRDGERHVELLRQSRLDWTVVRSPVMTNARSTGYLLDNHRPAPWALVSRRAVARAMVDQIVSRENLRQAPYIH